MRLPRDLDADDLIKALHRIGYRPIRQTGSHVRLQRELPTPHALTIPRHSPLKIGTLSSILGDVAAAADLSREALLLMLFP